MKIRFSLSLTDLLSLPDQKQQWEPCREVDGRQHAPRNAESVSLTERQGIEANSEREQLTRQVDDGADLGGLRLVTIGTVGICQGGAGLKTDARHCHTNSKTNPMGFVLHANPSDDQSSGNEEGKRRKVQSDLRFSVSIVALGVSVDK